MAFILIPAFLTTATDPSHSFRITINVSLIMTLFHPIVILNGGKTALLERWKPAMCHKAKNLLLW